LLLATNSEGRTPTTNVKARFKMALDEAAQRYANRKATERTGGEQAARPALSSTPSKAAIDATIDVDDLTAKVDDVAVRVCDCDGAVK
jgi:hypothetical protein